MSVKEGAVSREEVCYIKPVGSFLYAGMDPAYGFGGQDDICFVRIFSDQEMISVQGNIRIGIRAQADQRGRNRGRITGLAGQKASRADCRGIRCFFPVEAVPAGLFPGSAVSSGADPANVFPAGTVPI